MKEKVLNLYNLSENNFDKFWTMLYTNNLKVIENLSHEDIKQKILQPQAEMEIAWKKDIEYNEV